MSQVKRIPKPVDSGRPHAELWGDRVTLRKTVSVDDTFLQQTPREHHRLLSRLERGKKKLRNIHVSNNKSSQAISQTGEREKMNVFWGRAAWHCGIMIKYFTISLSTVIKIRKLE